MVPFVDNALVAFIDALFPNHKYKVVNSPPEFTRQYIAVASDNAEIGPGISVWRNGERKQDFASLPMATQGYNNGRVASGDYNDAPAIPVEVEYIVTGYARESSDIDEITRELWFCDVYKTLPTVVRTVGASLYFPYAKTEFAAGTHSYSFEVDFIPLVAGFCSLLFDGVKVASDVNQDGNFVFVDGYSSYQATINYTTGLVTLATTNLAESFLTQFKVLATAATENTYSFFMKQSELQREWIYDEKTKKALWYSVTKRFYVSTMWLHSKITPQIKSIVVTYTDPTNEQIDEVQTISANSV